VAKLYIHIGHPKTGSTSIQQTLFANEARLREHGIRYYSNGFTKYDDPADPMFLFRDDYFPPKAADRGARYNADKKELEEFRRSFGEHLLAGIRDPNCRKYVISCEMFAAELDADQVQVLKSFFINEVESIKIICYVREPASWLTSIAAQELVGRGKFISELTYLGVPFREVISKYIDVFGRDSIDIREFNPKVFRDKSLMADFFDALEEPAFDVGGLKELRLNEAISAQAALILDQLNQAIPIVEGDRWNSRRAFAFKQAFTQIAGDPFRLPAEILQPVVESCREDIDWLRTIVGRPIFTDEEPVVDSGAQSLPGGWSQEVLRSIGLMINDVLLKEQHGRAQQRTLKATIEIAKENDAEAARLLRQALDLNPDHPHARKRLEALERRSEKKAKQAKKQQREAQRALLQRAKAAEEAADWAGAAATLTELLALAPDHQVARRRLEALERRSERKEKQARNKRQESRRTLLQRAKAAEEAEDWVGAVAALTELLALAPDHQVARRRLEAVERRSERKEKQEKNERQETRRTLLQRAKAAEEAEDWAGATATLTELLALAPDHQMARRRLEAVERRSERKANQAKKQQREAQRPLMERAKAAEKAEDWAGAAGAWAELLAVSPSELFRDRYITALYRSGAEEEAYRQVLEAIRTGTGSVKPPLVRRSLLHATETSDRSAIPLLVEAFEELRANVGQPRPSSLTASPAIWRGLVLQGEIEAALRHFEAPPARYGDEADAEEAKGPAAGGADRQRPLRAIVVDPAFMPTTGHGHHFNTNLAYSHLLSRLGIPSEFYGAVEANSSFQSKDFNLHPVLTLPMYMQRKNTSDLQSLLNLNSYFKAELDRQVPPDERLYIFHCMRNTTILGMVDWLAEKAPEGGAVLIGVIDADLGTNIPERKVIESIYTKAFDALRELGKRLNVLIYCETEDHVALLRELGASDFEIQLMPYVASSLALDFSPSGQTPIAADDRLTLGFIGGTRQERGADLIPGIIPAVRQAVGNKVRWIVQLNLKSLRGMSADDMGTQIDNMAIDPDVELVEGGVSVEDYFALLSRLDIVVLPYRDRYMATGSGVFAEALTLGKVQVLPARGWMAEFLRNCGGEPVTFEEATVAGVSAAIEEAVGRYGELKPKAAAAAAAWNKEGSTARLEAWLRAQVSHGIAAPDPRRDQETGDHDTMRHLLRTFDG